MTSVTSVLLATSGGFFTGAAVMQAIPDPTWDKIAGGGAALLVSGILVFVLKHLDKSHEQCSAAVAKVAADFAATSKETSAKFAASSEATSAKFADTALMLHREMRESSERREDTLHQLIRKQSP